MTNFAAFDTRGYRTVDARRGYAEWAATYEATVKEAMDLPLLDELHVDWHAAREVADLACGTGRTGTWMRAHGVGEIDGVDLTPEMLAGARARGVYRRLLEGDVAATDLAAGAYDVVMTCLVDEHLATLDPLYGEAFRLARAGGTFILVGFHPHFIMASGMPTHFDSAEGEPIAIETHVHQLSEHITAGLDAGWALTEMRERVIDDEWIALKRKWEPLRGHPVAFALAWRKG